ARLAAIRSRLRLKAAPEPSRKSCRRRSSAEPASVRAASSITIRLGRSRKADAPDSSKSRLGGATGAAKLGSKEVVALFALRVGRGWKSTLIGRLLYDCSLLLEDQLAALATDSARFGTASSDLDMALLVDGLQAEREQGINIDVAYRYFATRR